MNVPLLQSVPFWRFSATHSCHTHTHTHTLAVHLSSHPKKPIHREAQYLAHPIKSRSIFSAFGYKGIVHARMRTEIPRPLNTARCVDSVSYHRFRRRSRGKRSQDLVQFHRYPSSSASSLVGPGCRLAFYFPPRLPRGCFCGWCHVSKAHSTPVRRVR